MMHPRNLFIWLLSVFIWMGCSQLPQHKDTHELPNTEVTVKNFIPDREFSKETVLKKDLPLTNTISLTQAMYKVLEKHPELEAISWELKKRDIEILRAGLWQNPTFSLEVENFIGSNDQQAFDSAEFTLQFSQTIELGGKISQREQVALLEKGVDVWKYQEKQIEILQKTANAFIEFIADQERLKLIEELYELTKGIHEAVEIRVKSGKVSPVEAIKTKIILAEIDLENSKQRQNLETSKKFLASLWSEKFPVFEKADGNYYHSSPLPDLATLNGKITQHPKIQRILQSIRRNTAVVALEKANQIPNITVGLGTRFFNETEDAALVAGISIPIPIFNDNRQNVSIAELETTREQKEMEAAKLELELQLTRTYQEAKNSLMEIQKLRDEIIIDAHTSFDSIKEGYQQGKFSYLDVLDAQRILFDVRKRYVDALQQYHTHIIEIKSIVPSFEIGDEKNEKD